MDALTTAALQLAEHGLFVLPVGLDKQPATRHGVYDATTDPATIERWFAGRSGRGLALAMGGPGRLLTIDADRHTEGIDGVAAYHELFPDAGEPWQTTPSAGEHHVWRWPATVKSVGCGAGVLAPGVDHRGQGGIIVVAPTVTPKGAYRWQRDILTHAIPELAAKITHLLTHPRLKLAATGDGSGAALPPVTFETAIGKLAAARPGTRNNQLNLSAYLIGRLVAAGTVKEDDARRVLTETALNIGLTPRETAATIASGLGDGMAARGVVPVSETIENAWRCLAWGLSACWPGRTGLSDRRVYVAHAMIALTCGQEVYDASVRRLAELANISAIETARKANHRLVEHGLIELIHAAKRQEFTPNGWKLRMKWTYTQEGHSPEPPLGICLFSAHPTVQGHDAFNRKGLGPTAAIVFDSLRAEGPATAAQLAERNRRGRRGVEKALKAMTLVVDVVTGETYHMLTKTGATYAAREDVDLDAVARLLHVDGEGQRRHERHMREQETHSRSWQEARARQKPSDDLGQGGANGE